MLADEDRDWLLGRRMSAGSMSPRETLTPRTVGEGVVGRVASRQGERPSASPTSPPTRVSPAAAPGHYQSGGLRGRAARRASASRSACCVPRTATTSTAFAVEEANVLRLLGMQVSAAPGRRIPRSSASLEAAEHPRCRGRRRRSSRDRSAPSRTPTPSSRAPICDGRRRRGRARARAATRRCAPCRARARRGAGRRSICSTPRRASCAREASATTERDAAIARACRAKRGLTGAVLQTGVPWRRRSPASRPALRRRRRHARAASRGPLLCVPLTLAGQGRSACCARSSAEQRAASPRTAEVLAAVLSAAVRNVLLYRSLLESDRGVAGRGDGAGARWRPVSTLNSFG